MSHFDNAIVVRVVSAYVWFTGEGQVKIHVNSKNIKPGGSDCLAGKLPASEKVM